MSSHLSLPLIASAPLVDGFARRVSYVRISLTDRCNYRCQYCMPESGVDLVPKSEVLSFEEIERIVRALMVVGVKRVRLTGGEPTVRKDLVELVRRLGALGLDDLALTTNGQLLGELAGPLRRAGLNRLNISLDTLDPGRFVQITRRGDIAAVVAGIAAAAQAGFRGTKLNAVVMGGVNDDELAELCEFAWVRDLVPRFIEFMPMSDGALFAPGEFFSAAAMRREISARFGSLVSDEASDVPGVGPARYLRVGSGAFAGQRVGIISAVTEPFCETCNRVRLSATGQLHTCLAIDDSVDLRLPLRAGVSDDELRDRIMRAVGEKKEGHSFTACGTGGPKKHMVAIGG